MAVRLPVIMIHTPPAGTSQQGLAESIVGQLIGMPGIDLALVGPIHSLAESSTDRLTMEAMSGDVAILDWQLAERSLADLSAIGFEGRRAPHAHDPHARENGVATTRRVYAFDLGQFSDASAVVAALVELRDHRQVKAIQIGPAPPKRRASAPVQEASPRISTPHQPQPPVPDRAESTNSIDLDQLLDQLDELDP